jgi:hypothetical protein
MVRRPQLPQSSSVANSERTVIARVDQDQFTVSYCKLFSNGLSFLMLMKGRIKNVFVALVSFMAPRVRHVEASIKRISKFLKEHNTPIADNHISACLNELERMDAIRRILPKSSNHFVINPYIAWCGRTEDYVAAENVEPRWSRYPVIDESAAFDVPDTSLP